MDFSLNIETISMRSVHLTLFMVKAKMFWTIVYFCPWRFALILTNSADPCKMKYYAAFYLCLHCLQIDPLRGFSDTKG